MMLLVVGGSASGKSAYAESLFLDKPKKTYLATMEPGGAEAKARIEKHRKSRAGLGFLTVECPKEIGKACPACNENVLLEDIGNLVANEMFSDKGRFSHLPEIQGESASSEGEAEVIAQTLFDEILKLREASEYLVIVTNEVFSDGADYDETTKLYLSALARLNALLAEAADEVREVIYSIPKRRK
ncbi:MAG: bifunctional adenosylcobinamide kinase/adenosylcobinamide-phosphate guanylyltransferase [Lachnospiraceae bacterium]|nr:bifunctional adenosylcobinamide kinase/adenosylcobinamide-phosphate guanylyltransferase [Lachnospiraceae bacterium]